MCRISYGIEDAARATGLDVAEIHLAVRQENLILRTVPGRVTNEPIVIAADLSAWVATFNRWSY